MFRRSLSLCYETFRSEQNTSEEELCKKKKLQKHFVEKKDLINEIINFWGSHFNLKKYTQKSKENKLCAFDMK